MEGLLASSFDIMNIDLGVPDHTSRSRSSPNIGVRPPNTLAGGRVEIIVDATGLNVFGEGEWTRAKHGRRGCAGWKKLHLGVDAGGIIVSSQLTLGNVADLTALPRLMKVAGVNLKTVTADGASDSDHVSNLIAQRGAKAIIPPRKGALSTGARHRMHRNRAIRRTNEVGRAH